MEGKRPKGLHAGAIYVGTSGWSYDHWQGIFYPERLSSADRLAYFAKHFRTVEINSSFYRLPRNATLERWRSAVSPDFLFSVKASRYITHMKKLNDPESSTRAFFESMSLLADNLGPILFQLPPRWSFNEQRLDRFLAALPTRYAYAFEFRDRSWLDDRAFALLERHNAVLCIYDLAGFRSPARITGDFVYVRLHGPAAAYRDSYDASVLAAWADSISEWSERGLRVYCYFNNDTAAHAVKNAAELESILQERRL